jgi:hypothetical protein
MITRIHLIFALAIGFLGDTAQGCTQLCGRPRRFSRMNQFAMCDLTTNADVCVLAPFVARRQRSNHLCGPCATAPIQRTQVQCVPNEAIALTNFNETMTLILPINQPRATYSSLCSLWHYLPRLTK